MNIGMTPPKYVRALNVKNATNSDLNVRAFFQSGAEKNFVVEPMTLLKIQQEINHGTYTVDDPLLKVEAKAKEMNQNLTFDPAGVEIYNYEAILMDDNSLAFNPTPSFI